MSTNNTEGFNFKITTMGREEFDARKPCNLKTLTLKKLHDWIDGKAIDERVREELKKMSATYPQQALVSWQRNFNRYLAKAQNALRNKPVVKPELGEDPLPESESNAEET